MKLLHETSSLVCWDDPEAHSCLQYFPHLEQYMLIVHNRAAMGPTPDQARKKLLAELEVAVLAAKGLTLPAPYVALRLWQIGPDFVSAVSMQDALDVLFEVCGYDAEELLDNEDIELVDGEHLHVVTFEDEYDIEPWMDPYRVDGFNKIVSLDEYEEKSRRIGAPAKVWVKETGRGLVSSHEW